MRINRRLPDAEPHIEPGAIADALQLAADQRDHLTSMRADGLAAAGAEALCNGALRHAIRVSVEHAHEAAGERPRSITRRQMDKLVRIISRRRFVAAPSD